MYPEIFSNILKMSDFIGSPFLSFLLGGSRLVGNLLVCYSFSLLTGSSRLVGNLLARSSFSA
jgi:hypothetical protein